MDRDRSFSPSYAEFSVLAINGHFDCTIGHRRHSVSGGGMLPLGASIVGKASDSNHPDRQCDEAGQISSRPTGFCPQGLHHKNAAQSQDDKGE